MEKFQAIVHIEGMACPHCQASVEKGLGALEGVESAVVNLEAGQAAITTTVAPAELPIEKTITDLGFTFKGIDA